MSQSRACADEPRDAVAVPPTHMSRIALITHLAPCFLAAVVHRPPRPSSSLSSGCRLQVPARLASSLLPMSCAFAGLRHKCVFLKYLSNRHTLHDKLHALLKDRHCWKDPYWNWFYSACFIYIFVCFPCFNFVLDSRYSPLVVPYRLCHWTPSTTTCFDFAPAVTPLTCHLFAIII